MIPSSPSQLVYAPWMPIAHRYTGLRELDDAGELVETVRDFFRFTRFPKELVNKRTAWCGAFACCVLEQAQIVSPRSAKARHFLPWGLQLKAPVYGSLLVFERSEPGKLFSESGHVAFCERAPLLASDDVLAFGGNQANSCCSRRKSLSTLIGVRWPVGFPLPPDGVLDDSE